MPYVNQPNQLKDIIGGLDDRLKKVETGNRFTFPVVTVDPTYPRHGDAWINSTTNTMKAVDSLGNIRVINWT